MIRQLYIDDMEVDIDNSVNIVRQYTSPFFSDVKDIINNGTYTVKVPQTERNAAIQEYLDREDMSTDFPYTLHVGKYYVNAFPIFENAEVKVLAPFEYQFVWGVNKTEIQNLFTKKLRDIVPLIPSDWISRWDLVSENQNYTKKFKYLDYVSVERTSESEVIGGVQQPLITAPEPFLTNQKAMTIHPFVPLNNIIDLINSDNSNVFDFTYLKDRLTTKGIILSGNKSNNTFNHTKDYDTQTFTFSPDTNKLKIFGALNQNDFLLTFEENFIYRNPLMYGLKTYMLNISFNLVITNNIGNIYYKVYDKNFNVLKTEILPKTIGGSDFIYDTIITVDNSNDDVYGIEFFISNYVSNFSINIGTINFELINKDAIYSLDPNNENGRYNVIDNLPDMTQIEFLNECLILSGLAFGFDSTGNLKLRSFDTLKSNLYSGNITDFSGRISSSLKSQYQFNANAQKNIVKYNNADNLTYTNKGEIIVNDLTLEAEKDLYTLKFDLPEKSLNGNVEFIQYKQSIKSGSSGVKTFEQTFEEKPIVIACEHPKGLTVDSVLPINTDLTISELWLLGGRESDNPKTCSFEAPEVITDIIPDVGSKVISIQKYPDAEIPISGIYVTKREGLLLTFNDDLIPTNDEYKVKFEPKVYGILEYNYDVYRKLINRPIVKEIEVNMDFYESANIDFEKPVYIKEFGKYAVLLDLQCPDNEVSVAKLLLINQTI